LVVVIVVVVHLIVMWRGLIGVGMGFGGAGEEGPKGKKDTLVPFCVTLVTMGLLLAML
jgi:hypothetical protein